MASSQSMLRTYVVRSWLGQCSQTTKASVAGRLTAQCHPLPKPRPATHRSCKTIQRSTCVVGAERGTASAARPNRSANKIRQPTGRWHFGASSKEFSSCRTTPSVATPSSCPVVLSACSDQGSSATTSPGPTENYHALALASAWNSEPSKNRPLQSQPACPHSTAGRERASCNHRLLRVGCTGERPRNVWFQLHQFCFKVASRKKAPSHVGHHVGQSPFLRPAVRL